MRIGALRRRLTFERATDVADDAGGFDRSYVAEGTVFAAVHPRRRGEGVEHGRSVGVVTHHVVVRWRDDVGADVRFTDGSARYRVLTTEPEDPQRRFLRCLCEEEQA